MQNVIFYLARLCALVPVLVLHEFAHAFVAYRCGDDTAKLSGRLTLNPLKHFDIAGLVLFLLVGFGWAKPVPINPNNFKHYKRDLFFTSAAGITVNLILAFLFCPFLLLVKPFAYDNYLFFFLYSFFFFFFWFNLNFFVFNLIPLFPLDGFRIWDALSRKRGKVFRFIRQYGYWILLGLIIESYICDLLSDVIPIFAYFDILGYYLSFVVNLIATPIQAFWGLFI